MCGLILYVGFIQVPKMIAKISDLIKESKKEKAFILLLYFYFFSMEIIALSITPLYIFLHIF
jgi:hypothetical protein